MNVSLPPLAWLYTLLTFLFLVCHGYIHNILVSGLSWLHCDIPISGLSWLHS